MGSRRRLPGGLRDVLVFFYGAIVCPFVDFFVRYRWHGITLLAFIGLFRLSDIAMGVMANPFYIDIGFSLDQIANVTKLYGFVMQMLGAFLGGTLVFRIGAARLLAPSVILIAVSNLAFTWLAWVGRPDTLILTAAISIDNLVSGMAGTVFIAFLSGLSRPTAAVLIGAVGLAALVTLVRQDSRREQGVAAPLYAAVAAPLGLLTYVGWVGW